MVQQLGGLLRTMRPKQWTKNGFIFIPLLFDRQLTDINAVLMTLAGFVFLCMMSSTVYIMNDLADIEEDRQHPTKKNRPLPAGVLSPTLATGAVVVLPLVTLPLSFLISPWLTAVLAGYLVLQIAYTFQLKHMVLLDVMTIAAGFVLRVAAGQTTLPTQVERFSPWLYLFTTMLALYLGFAKRRQELILLEGKAGSTRKILEEYNLKLLDEMMVIVTATTILTYALYTFSAEGLPENNSMMLTIPFVVYGIFRYMWLIHVKGELAPPDEVLLKDRPLQIAVVLWGIAVIVILYVVAPL